MFNAKKLTLAVIMHLWIARRVGGCSEVRIKHRSVIYIGGGDLRIYGHGFIYMDICNIE